MGQYGGWVHAIAVDSGRAYYGVGPRLHVLDVSAPDRPRHVSASGVLGGLISDVAAVGSRAYVIAGGEPR